MGSFSLVCSSRPVVAIPRVGRMKSNWLNLLTLTIGGRHDSRSVLALAKSVTPSAVQASAVQTPVHCSWPSRCPDNGRADATPVILSHPTRLPRQLHRILHSRISRVWLLGHDSNNRNRTYFSLKNSIPISSICLFSIKYQTTKSIKNISINSGKKLKLNLQMLNQLSQVELECKFLFFFARPSPKQTD